MYWLLLQVFGLAQVTEDFEEIGVVMLIVLLILGNVTFFLLDKLLEKRLGKQKVGGRGMWYLYILQCGDGSLYTGITTDVEKRLEAHRSGKGAKYTGEGRRWN